MPFELPELPYAKDALAPHMSANTFDFHHGKHLKAYVDNLNKMIDGTPHADKSLEEIVLAAHADKNAGLFNNSEFKQAGMTQFGSGWAWLTLDNGNLKITKTPNAELPLIHGQKALVTCDVWEHAYYLDFQNRRPDFLSTFLDHLINWDFVAKNLAA